MLQISGVIFFGFYSRAWSVRTYNKVGVEEVSRAFVNECGVD